MGFAFWSTAGHAVFILKTVYWMKTSPPLPAPLPLLATPLVQELFYFLNFLNPEVTNILLLFRGRKILLETLRRLLAPSRALTLAREERGLWGYKHIPWRAWSGVRAGRRLSSPRQSRPPAALLQGSALESVGREGIGPFGSARRNLNPVRLLCRELGAPTPDLSSLFVLWPNLDCGERPSARVCTGTRGATAALLLLSQSSERCRGGQAELTGEPGLSPVSCFMQKEQVLSEQSRLCRASPDTRCDCCQKTLASASLTLPGRSALPERGERGGPSAASVCACMCVRVCWPTGLGEGTGRIKAIRILLEFPSLA